MSDLNAQDLVERTFLRLRQKDKDYSLGAGEYLAALQALEGGFGDDVDVLKETLKLLWCSSVPEQAQFDQIWKSVLTAAKPKEQVVTQEVVPQKDLSSLPQADPIREERTLSQSQTLDIQPDQQPEAELSSIPVQAPTVSSSEPETTLQAYYPISKRSMVYGWRYLRRPVLDGPADVLDIDATVEQATNQGFYLSPAYARREQNHAQLLMLVDQNGSMMPFHRFTRDLIDTALQESPLLPKNVSVFYFQNVTTANVHKNPFLTDPIPLQTVLSACDPETSVLIVSDAGAARGFRQLDRIRSTTRFLRKIKRHTTLLAWLNPMPQYRWIGSSAEIIASLVPMYQMDNAGLSNAVDVLRGQPRPHFDLASS